MQETITLTVVAISAGAAKIQADWNVWNTIAAYPYPPSFCFGWTTCVDYAVVGADIDTDSNNDGYIDHATDDPVEDQYPGACLARYSGHAEELSEVDIRSIGVTDPEADLLTGKVTFTGDIRVGADRDRTEEITSGTQWDLYYTGELPTAVYVEGENAGQSSMTWTVFAGETQSASDTVKFSLYRIADRNQDGAIGRSSGIRLHRQHGHRYAPANDSGSGHVAGRLQRGHVCDYGVRIRLRRRVCAAAGERRGLAILAVRHDVLAFAPGTRTTPMAAAHATAIGAARRFSLP